MGRLVDVNRRKTHFTELYKLYAQQGVKEKRVGSSLCPRFCCIRLQMFSKAFVSQEVL